LSDITAKVKGSRDDPSLTPDPLFPEQETRGIKIHKNSMSTRFLIYGLLITAVTVPDPMSDGFVPVNLIRISFLWGEA
jgi:hypothetical protein